MENVGRCPRCNEFLVAENRDGHVCREYIAVKGIDIDYFFETDSTEGKVIIAKGIDGTLYRLTLRDKDLRDTAVGS